MIDSFVNLNPIIQALFATLFTWGITAIGAATVFIVKDVGRRMMDCLLGFSGGVMLAASYWSLLAPSIEMSQSKSVPVWFPPASGFVLGVILLWSIDKILPHLHLDLPVQKAEGIRTTWRKSVLLVLAITLHNIPEGLAVGVAFGAVSSGLPSATLAAAITLAIGIGIQNFPEGLAVSMPLRREGMSRLKSFWYGQLSAMVEPVAAIIGAAAVIIIEPILPYALSFAAGAMIFVVVEELIPESQTAGNTDLATIGITSGFVVMMVLEVAFN